jgi:hypothetical protein
MSDRALGEWWERGSRGIVHLRRRLSVDEMEAFGVTSVRDIRGTPGELERLKELVDAVPTLARAFRAIRP